MKCVASNLSLAGKLRKRAINQSTQFMFIAFATYLGDKRGWKSESIVRALKWINKFAEMLLENYLTLDEAKQDLKENYGLTFDDNGHVYFDMDFERKDNNA